MTLEDLFAKQRILLSLRKRTEELLTTLNQELVSKHDEFFQLSLKELVALPISQDELAVGQYRRLIAKLAILIAHLGGVNAIRDWVEHSLQNQEWKTVWLEKKFQERDARGSQDPRWLTDLDQRRRLGSNQLIPVLEAENVVWFGNLLLMLRLYYVAIQEEIVTLELAIRNAKQKDEEDSSLASLTSPTLPQTINQSPDSQADQIRTQQQSSVKQNKIAYLAYLQRFPARINKHLDHLHQLDEQRVNNLIAAAQVGVVFPDDNQHIMSALGAFGLLELLGNNPAAIQEAIGAYRDLNKFQRQEMADNGQSTKILVFTDSETDKQVTSNLMILGGRMGAKNLIDALTTKSAQLEKEAKLHTEDAIAQAKNQIAKEFATTLADTETKTNNPFGIVINALSQAIGSHSDKPQTPTDDPSAAILDRVGQTPPKVNENGTSQAAVPSQPQNPSRLKAFGETARKLADSMPLPVKLGLGAAGVGAVGAGVFISGLLAQAPGIMAAGGSLVGAGIGGSIGFLVGGPVGGLIGAGIGGSLAGGGSYLFGKQLFNHTPVSTSLVNLSSLGSQTAANVGASTNPLLAQGVNRGGMIATNALTNTNALLQSFSRLPSLFSSGLATGTLVTSLFSGMGVLAILGATAIVSIYLAPGTGSGNGESKYLAVTKTATPTHLEDSDVTSQAQQITYHITLKPKTDPATGQPYQVQIASATDAFSITSVGKPPIPSDPNVGDKIPANQPLATNGIDFTYTISVDKNDVDTRINNTITLNFTVTGVSDPQNTAKTVSVTIGTPPADMGCFNFAPGQPVDTHSPFGIINSKDWTDGEKQAVTEAFSVAAAYPNYINLLCHKNGQTVPINLYRFDGFQFGGWTISDNEIVLYDLTFGQSAGVPYPHDEGVIEARYTLIHESGHVIIHRDADALLTYMNSHSVLIPTYGWYNKSGTAPPDQESFAETLAVFTLFHNRQFYFNGTKGMFDMPNQVPNNYAWAKDQIFQGDPP